MPPYTADSIALPEDLLRHHHLREFFHTLPGGRLSAIHRDSTSPPLACLCESGPECVRNGGVKGDSIIGCLPTGGLGRRVLITSMAKRFYHHFQPLTVGSRSASRWGQVIAEPERPCGGLECNSDVLPFFRGCA